MKQCPKCQANISDSAKFCVKCGYNIKKYEEEMEYFCSECGTKFSGGVFCPECGHDISKDLYDEDTPAADAFGDDWLSTIESSTNADVANKQAAEEARARAEEAARQRAEEEARRRAAEEAARQKAEEEAKITAWKEKYKMGSEVIFGSYYKSNASVKEPIEWIVIKREDKDDRTATLTLWSKYALEYLPYEEPYVPDYSSMSKWHRRIVKKCLQEDADWGYNSTPNWKGCSLRKYLNDEFLGEAFSFSEQGQIINTGIQGSYYCGSESTDDKILIPIQTVVNSLSSTNHVFLRCIPTPYVKLKAVGKEETLRKWRVVGEASGLSSSQSYCVDEKNDFKVDKAYPDDSLPIRVQLTIQVKR